MRLVEELAEILKLSQAIQAKIPTADAEEMVALECRLEQRNQRLRALIDPGTADAPPEKVAEVLQAILDTDAVTRQMLQDGQRQLMEQLQTARRGQAASQSYAEIQSD